MNYEEDNIQRSCIEWFDMQYPKLGKLLYHIPNGGKRNAREASRFKRQGVRPGVADLFLSIPSGNHHGLYIEVKSSKGKQTDNQKEFETIVEKHGYPYRVIRSLDSFIELIKSYMKNRK